MSVSRRSSTPCSHPGPRSSTSSAAANESAMLVSHSPTQVSHRTHRGGGGACHAPSIRTRYPLQTAPGSSQSIIGASGRSCSFSKRVWSLPALAAARRSSTEGGRRASVGPPTSSRSLEPVLAVSVAVGVHVRVRVRVGVRVRVRARNNQGIGYDNVLDPRDDEPVPAWFWTASSTSNPKHS